MNKDELLLEMVNKQLKDVDNKVKLQYKDMKRICKYIESSIFAHGGCTLWTGYVCNHNNIRKGKFINFYFKQNKIALHRLLYKNFIAKLDSMDTLRFTCGNKGQCCNLNHMIKFTKQQIVKKNTPKQRPKKVCVKDNVNLFVDFED